MSVMGGLSWRRAPHEEEIESQAALPLGDADWLGETAMEPEPRRRWKEATLLAAILLVAIVWIGIVAMTVMVTLPAGRLDLSRAAAWIGVGSGPLTLLGLVVLLMFRTGRAEATRYARAARELRTEAHRLAELLTLVDRRIVTARQGLAKHGAELVRLGEETSERMGRAGEALRADAVVVAETASRLDDATASARTDLGVMLSDLPTLTAHAGDLGDKLRTLGRDAEEGSERLAATLSAIEGNAKAADQSSVAAARRLAIELERIEGSAAAADRRIMEAAAKLGEAADGALVGAAGALDQVRRGVAEQGASLSALVLQAREMLGRSGDESTRLLSLRLDQLSGRIEETSLRIAQHETGARGLLGQLEQALGGVEDRFERLGDKGAEHVADLAETLAMLADHGDKIGAVLGRSGDTAEATLARIVALREQAVSANAMLDRDLPETLARLRAQADDAITLLQAAGPRADDLVRTAEDLQGKLAESGALIEIGGERLGRFVAEADRNVAALRETIAATVGHGSESIARFALDADAKLATVREQIAAFDGLVARTDQEIAGLAEGASVKLVDALLRVRETAQQAATHARETLAGAIPGAAEQLAAASADAMAKALDGVGQSEIDKVAAASAAAADAATASSERLTRQLVTLTETTRAVEARIAEQQAAASATDEQSFARQVSLLIEALNSTAIDVAKIFSNQPTDAEWAAYLKGDRGVFTRRAVRLIEAGDAKAIVARYNDDGEFRAQVNRYVHDFEAMLRRVLAVREGAAMGVTLLSSDMGKLYVALAQAIERLRR